MGRDVRGGRARGDRRNGLVLAALAITLSACSGAGAAVPSEATPRAQATTTSAAPTTTTTTTTTTTAPVPDVTVTGAPAGLVTVISGFYGDGPPPPLPAPLVPPAGRSPAGPVEATASVASVDGVSLAVVVAGTDVLGAVDDGSGWRIVAGSAPSMGVEPWFGEPSVVAVVGSDARPGEPVERSRADSIHLVAFDGAGGASMVGIPRDSYVPVAGHGTRKINASLSLGGPDLFVDTVQRLAGYELDGYVITGFSGFQELVGGLLGGINIVLPDAIRDRASGADFPEGFQYMNGGDALAFSRARKSLADGDFGRQRNGGLVLAAVLGTAIARGPAALPGYLAAGDEWMVTDLSPERRLVLALAALDVDPGSVTNEVLPGRAVTRNGSSVVELSSEAPAMLADLADGSLDGG